MTWLAAILPTGVVILFGLLKISRQAGRIEEGVRGLYDRVEVIEDHLFRPNNRRR